jgi:hypothetical protein
MDDKFSNLLDMRVNRSCVAEYTNHVTNFTYYLEVSELILFNGKINEHLFFQLNQCEKKILFEVMMMMPAYICTISPTRLVGFFIALPH